jgi:hypothetical protein
MIINVIITNFIGKFTPQGYGMTLPDKQQKAVDTVLKQAEVLADYWVEK